jgi:hypothetical protein
VPEDKSIPTLRVLVRKLPLHNRYLWEEVNKFLFNLSKHSAVNMMTPQNIGIVIGPNVLWQVRASPVCAFSSRRAHSSYSLLALWPLSAAAFQHAGDGDERRRVPPGRVLRADLGAGNPHTIDDDRQTEL